MLRSVDTEIGDYGGNRHLSISQKQVEEVIRYASRYPKPKSPVIHYITMNSVKAFREQLPVQGIKKERGFVWRVNLVIFLMIYGRM